MPPKTALEIVVAEHRLHGPIQLGSATFTGSKSGGSEMAHAFAPLRLEARRTASRSPCAAIAHRPLRRRSRPPAARRTFGLSRLKDQRCRSAGRGCTSWCRSLRASRRTRWSGRSLRASTSAKTCFSQSGWANVFWAASNKRVGIGRCDACSPVKPRNSRAISRNQAYWTVLSKRSMWPRIAATRSRGEVLAAQRLVAHAGRVGQFRVVVVAEDVVERFGNRVKRIDVGVWIDEGNRTKGGVQVAGEVVGNHGEVRNAERGPRNEKTIPRPRSMNRNWCMSYRAPAGFTNLEQVARRPTVLWPRKIANVSCYSVRRFVAIHSEASMPIGFLARLMLIRFPVHLTDERRPGEWAAKAMARDPPPVSRPT